MKKVQLNLKYKQRGMTLVEVLIAGIILFISISVISMVARTKILNEQKLVNAINYAYLAEYSKSTVKYYLKHTQERQGSVFIAGTEYIWRGQVEEAKPLTLSLTDEDSNMSENESILTLYNVTITRIDDQKKLLEFLLLI